MIHFVTVTSQGQITLPAAVRRKYAFDKTKKIALRDTENGLIIEPVKDIMDLAGVFKTDKKIPFKKARKAFGEYLAGRSVRIGI